MIVVPTVPHTGTHFMRDHLLAELECHVGHPYPADQEKFYELLEAGHPCIVPTRRPWDVLESWIRHGKDPRDFGGYSLPEWYDVQAGLVMDYDPLYLAIDDIVMRDEQLAMINNTLGTVLTTDWPIVRQPGE